MSEKKDGKLIDCGTSKDGFYKRHTSSRAMGYECQKIADALGFVGMGFRRLVIEFDVDKPVTVYFQTYPAPWEIDKLCEEVKRLRDLGDVRVVECKSLEVGGDNGTVVHFGAMEHENCFAMSTEPELVIHERPAEQPAA